MLMSRPDFTKRKPWFSSILVKSNPESSQGEVGDNREKWENFWEKSIAINRNIVTRSL
jgi:hypothetical protein